MKDRLDFSYLCVGRLRPGVTVEQARAHRDVIAANLAREYPRTNKDVGVYVEPMLGQMTQAVRPALWLLLAAVGTLFLVGCVNLANLLLVRATGRRKEFAMREALGATRTKLVRQSFVETIPIAGAGAVFGVVAANWLLALLIPLLRAAMPRVEEIAIGVQFCSSQHSCRGRLRWPFRWCLRSRFQPDWSAALPDGGGCVTLSSLPTSPARSSCWRVQAC